MSTREQAARQRTDRGYSRSQSLGDPTGPLVNWCTLADGFTYRYRHRHRDRYRYRCRYWRRGVWKVSTPACPPRLDDSEPGSRPQQSLCRQVGRVGAASLLLARLVCVSWLLHPGDMWYGGTERSVGRSVVAGGLGRAGGGNGWLGLKRRETSRQKSSTPETRVVVHTGARSLT